MMDGARGTDQLQLAFLTLGFTLIYRFGFPYTTWVELTCIQ